jgi:hypothetical protein
MAIDAGADREAAEPDDDQLDAQAKERASDEGMPAPDQARKAPGEFELPSRRGNDDELGTDGADISGPVAGDD